MLVATNNSLQSEPCKEEFAYALGRALDTRGGQYPVIGLFLGPVDDGLIPAGIKTRLYVSATDPDWKERVVATAERRDLKVGVAAVEPFYLKVHAGQTGEKKFIIEVRPRAGVWAPFLAVILSEEKDRAAPSIMIGPRDRPTTSGALMMTGSGLSPDGKAWFMFAGNEATPTQSYYVACNQLPTKLLFGVEGRQPQYEVGFK